MEIRIRRAELRDETFIVSLAARFAETRPDWRTDEEVAGGTARVLREALRSPSTDAAIFIAEHGEKPSGFVFIVMENDFFTGEPHGHISEIAVADDGRGIGRALMDAAENWARQRGSRYISLNVNLRNERGLRFYESLGYAIEWNHLAKPLA
ncbi:MAG: GNAT family N-acetyltransferase [Candidatus Eremiobacteraeota bacterium]|nr:GNAT family N-acetyltransferase [Candidatus Eremiobacteraeota bacterium]